MKHANQDGALALVIAPDLTRELADTRADLSFGEKDFDGVGGRFCHDRVIYPERRQFQAPSLSRWIQGYRNGRPFRIGRLGG